MHPATNSFVPLSAWSRCDDTLPSMRSLRSLCLCAFVVSLTGTTGLGVQQGAPDAAAVAAGRKQYEALCAGCHGADAAGGERGPAFVGPGRVRRLSPDEMRRIIRAGVAGGMPAFDLPEAQLTELLAFIHSL